MVPTISQIFHFGAESVEEPHTPPASPSSTNRHFTAPSTPKHRGIVNIKPCEWTGPLKDMDTHLMECVFVKFPCDFGHVGCTKAISKTTAKAHYESYLQLHLSLLAKAHSLLQKQMVALTQQNPPPQTQTERKTDEDSVTLPKEELQFMKDQLKVLQKTVATLSLRIGQGDVGKNVTLQPIPAETKPKGKIVFTPHKLAHSFAKATCKNQIRKAKQQFSLGLSLFLCRGLCTIDFFGSIEEGIRTHRRCFESFPRW